MRYTVTWHSASQEKLARIWLAASNRRAVALAADEIEALLAESPETAGVDFYGDFMLTVPPLGVVYTVSHADRIVRVVHAWHADLIGE
jgi:hypothetical protein